MNDYAENLNLDLTLNSGLQNSDDQDQLQHDFVPNMALHGHTKLHVGGPNKYTQGINTHCEMRNAEIGSHNNISRQTFKDNDINHVLYAWPPSKMGKHAGQFSGSSTPTPLYTNHYQPHTNFNVNPNNHHIMPPPPPPPSEAINAYTLINVPARRAGRELGNISSSAGYARKIPGQRTLVHPNKRCNNLNCKTNDTPMWRRGPHGKNTLCNACGIQYQKDKKKRSREATGSGSRVELNQRVQRTQGAVLQCLCFQQSTVSEHIKTHASVSWYQSVSMTTRDDALKSAGEMFRDHDILVAQHAQWARK
ncbi:hypothetical protein Ddye_020022 [Dipteronia dyeriana]|uniref:GATA-type domain-containing protein n=1 Tax=Dipteronia dyeriana TaxID=168575 RepID=A0AAD9TZ64_9ROSI|nr:hypothetical protein Ddye_020022 [Dipteronia dyeriana]